MSTTTQILFNSPALHSLKRDQLLKLCKIHSLKASGKNVELVERLKKHALTLPPEASAESFAEDKDNMQGADGDSEDDDEKEDVDSRWQRQIPRPSEQWEMVMESIQEEGSSQGTLTSLKGAINGGATGEFGTGSSKSSSVGSSIKALATSLGLKRNTSSKSILGPSTSKSSILSSSSSTLLSSQADIERYAMPYSSVPPTSTPPQTDHFKLSSPAVIPHTPSDAEILLDADTSLSAPIPGQGYRSGKPAPVDARLSVGGGISSTTIRLVSVPFAPEQPSTPQLKPFETAFDLIEATPGVGLIGKRINVWPASPTSQGNLYPSISSLNDPITTHGEEDVQIQDEETAMPGALPPSTMTMNTPLKPSPPQPQSQPVDLFSPAPRATLAPADNTRSSTLSPLPRSQPFIFGSPLPQHNLSNGQFKSAAASVLEEMNKRLAEAGVQKVDTSLLDRAKGASLWSGNTDDQSNRKPENGDRFNKAHEDQFKKMDSIATHYAAKRASPDKKRKSSALGVGDGRGPSKRKSSLGTRAAGARVISNGVRKKVMVPGAFDEEDDELDNDSRRASKRPRVVKEDPAGAEENIQAGTSNRVTITTAPAVQEAGESGTTDSDAERKKQKEREAIRRKLDMNKARRRSSMGRVSVGGGRPPLMPNQKAKGSTSRFGFLSSAKSMVQSVWNRGVGAKATSSSVPVPKGTSAVAATKSIPLMKKSAAISSHPSTTVEKKNMNRVTSIGSTSKLAKPSITVTTKSEPAITNTHPSSARSRSPIPPFGPSSSKGSANSTVSSRVGQSIGAASSRTSLHVGGPSGSRLGSRNSSIAGSSMGARGSMATTSNISSLGTRNSLARAVPSSSTGLKRTSSAVDTTGRKRISSTLMAPTASSLAKMQSLSRIPIPTSNNDQPKSPGSAAIPKALSRAEHGAQAQFKLALEQITNSPAPGHKSMLPRSPGANKIFSNPLSIASPTVVRNGATPSSSGPTANMSEKAPAALKPKVLAGRKPRISRSRVIAKLASQRAASNSLAAVARPSDVSSRTRSSVGERKSHGGIKRGSAADNVLMSAKKRARQSEYARRRSRAAVGGLVSLTSGASPRLTAMDVDAD